MPARFKRCEHNLLCNNKVLGYPFEIFDFVNGSGSYIFRNPRPFGARREGKAMAIYHLHAQMIKRSSGRSAVAAAAYRAGEKLHNDYEGITHDYTRKSGVVHTEIMLPKTAPKEYKDRSTLWNAVEQAEKRKDSQTAREIDIALPVELNKREQISLVKKYIKENFVDKGMIADFAIHNKQDGNPHAHIMLTTREVSKKGFGGKNREWNKTELLEQWREDWATACNEKLQAKGIDERIDHRTLKAQGVDREPTIHVGAAAKAMERSGRDSDRIRECREIVAQNKVAMPEITAEYIHEVKQGYIILDKEITDIKQQTAETQREMQSLNFRIEKIDERVGNIQTLKSRIAELKAERQAMGILKSKKFIDDQIGRFENSLEQMKYSFKKEYYVFPEEAAAEIKRLEFKAKDFERVQERLWDRLAPIVAEKEVFMFEYQQQKLLAGISPGGQIIKDKLSQLDKESMQQLSAQGKTSYMRSMHVLDIVTERSFQRILDDVKPEQQRKLIRQRERERAWEHIRIRCR